MSRQPSEVCNLFTEKCDLLNPNVINGSNGFLVVVVQDDLLMGTHLKIEEI